MRVLSIGDCHTKTWIIDKVEKVVDNYDSIVFVGDFCDDWEAGPMDSINTLRLIKDLQDEYPEKVQSVIANHEFIYIHKTPTLASGYNAITQTLIDAPENKDLKSWLRQLPTIITIDGVAYSHAGITNTWDGKKTIKSMWANNSPIWARPQWSNYKNIPQVFGHTPSETCWEVQPNVWCIDTWSTHRDGTPVGDKTVLEIIDGKEFIIKEIDKIHNDNNNSTNSIKR